MKSGQLRNKMSARHPTLNATPPVFSTEAALADLKKVRELTEAPAREAMRALTEEGEGVVIPVAPEKPEEAPAAPPVQPDKKIKAKSDLPWENEDLGVGLVAMTFRVPAKLASQLRYAAGITYGSTINSVATEAIESRVVKILKAHGLLK